MRPKYSRYTRNRSEAVGFAFISVLAILAVTVITDCPAVLISLLGVFFLLMLFNRISRRR